MKESTKNLLELMTINGGDVGMLARAILEMRRLLMPESTNDEQLREKLRSIIGNISLPDKVAPTAIENQVAANEKGLENLMQLIHQHTEQIHKAYGNCRKCYGKGYATKQEFVSGGGKKWKTSDIKYCECSRGEQLRQHIEQAVREALLNHKCPRQRPLGGNRSYGVGI